MTGSKIVRVDTNTEVDYITVTVSGQFYLQFSLYTEDWSLVGTTVEYRVLVDLSDGQTDLEAAVISVSYEGANNAPYFQPELTGMIQVYK